MSTVKLLCGEPTVTEKKMFPTQADAIAGAASSGAIITKTAAVPWDAALLKGRECSSCACYFEQANPDNALQSQGFCRRLPADMQQMRALEPRRDPKGSVVLGKDNQPIMQPTQVVGYLFKPTKRDGTCFDGWRELDTLPGERSIDATIRRARDSLEPLLTEIPKEVRPFLAAVFGIIEPGATIRQEPNTREQ
jgi:hypothetical protein